MAQTTSPGTSAGAGATNQAGHANKHHLPLLVLGALPQPILDLVNSANQFVG